MIRGGPTPIEDGIQGPLGTSTIALPPPHRTGSPAAGTPHHPAELRCSPAGGGLAVDAIVAWDNLRSGVTPRVPALGMSADYGLVPMPKGSDPDPEERNAGFEAWRGAGVDAMQVNICSPSTTGRGRRSPEGTAVACDDLRSGCGVLKSDDGEPRDLPYSYLEDRKRGR